MNNKEFGNFGEKEAAKFLKKKKYKILDTNYRVKNAEIDIIAMDNKTLCFIEVKTRKNDIFGKPCEAVDLKKQQKIKKGAQSYIYYNQCDCEIRFDVVEVYADRQNEKILVKNFNLIKNAF